MTEPQGTESGPSLLSTSVALEQELRTVVRKKGVLEKEAHQLRRSLRICYTNLILNHYELSVQHDVEQNLWKIIFYKVIEALRARLRRLKSVRASNPSDSLESGLQKTSMTFSAFLTSASKFYVGLVAKLEQAFGLLSGDSPDYILPDDRSPENELRHLGYLSCYRCYIFLGDLTRYIRDIGGNSSEWMTAAKYYNRALRLFPTNGNPHNQLAVLATYVNDDFNAMYHYFRSIAAENPFPTSKENLVVLFEKNRAQAENLQEALAPLLNGRRRTPENRVLRDSFLVFFIRIHGIIFNKISAEKISQFKTLALKGFEDLLQQRRSGDQGSGISEPLLLKVFAINVYAIWFCMAECDIHPGDSYAEKMKKSVILRHAAKIAVEFFGRTVRACQASKQLSDMPFLGPLSAFTDWFGENVTSLMPTSSQDKGPWHQMWKAFISFLNKLLEGDPSLRYLGSNPASFLPPRSGADILREEIEMRGFLPFKEIHKKLSFSGIPLFDFSPFEVGEDEDRCRAVRIKKLIAFGFQVSKSPEIQSLHYLEEKGVFSDRRASSGNKKNEKKRNKNGNSATNTPSGGGSRGMDPNAVPINPYESDISFDGLISESPILVSSETPQAMGGLVIPDELGDYGSEDDDDEILFQPDISSPALARPHQNGNGPKIGSFQEEHADKQFSNFLSSFHTDLDLADPHENSSATPSPIPSSSPSSFPPISPSKPSTLSDFTFPRQSPPSPSQPSLSDFSYPFAPNSTEGRVTRPEQVVLSTENWTDQQGGGGGLENDVGASWGSLGLDQWPLHQSSPSEFHLHANWTGSSAGGVGVDRRVSLSPSPSLSASSSTFVDPSPLLSTSHHHPIMFPMDLGSRDQGNSMNAKHPLNGLPSFFLSSMSTPTKYETLEDSGEKEDDESGPPSDSESLIFPIMGANPIEDEEEEEEDEVLGGIGIDLIGKSPVRFPFGPSSGPKGSWQSMWKSNLTGPPPGFGPPQSPHMNQQRFGSVENGWNANGASGSGGGEANGWMGHPSSGENGWNGRQSIGGGFIGGGSAGGGGSNFSSTVFPKQHPWGFSEEP